MQKTLKLGKETLDYNGCPFMFTSPFHDKTSTSVPPERIGGRNVGGGREDTYCV